jgi:hypothetical protein
VAKVIVFRQCPLAIVTVGVDKKLSECVTYLAVSERAYQGIWMTQIVNQP